MYQIIATSNIVWFACKIKNGVVQSLGLGLGLNGGDQDELQASDMEVTLLQFTLQAST